MESKIQMHRILISSFTKKSFFENVPYFSIGRLADRIQWHKIATLIIIIISHSLLSQHYRVSSKKVCMTSSREIRTNFNVNEECPHHSSLIAISNNNNNKNNRSLNFPRKTSHFRKIEINFIDKFVLSPVCFVLTMTPQIPQYRLRIQVLTTCNRRARNVLILFSNMHIKWPVVAVMYVTNVVGETKKKNTNDDDDEFETYTKKTSSYIRTCTLLSPLLIAQNTQTELPFHISNAGHTPYH